MPIDIKQINQSELSGYITGTINRTFHSVLGLNVVYSDTTNQTISGFKTFINPPNVPYAGTSGQVVSQRYITDKINFTSGSLNDKITLLSGQNFFNFVGDFISGDLYHYHDAVYYNGGTYGYTGVPIFTGIINGTPLSGYWHQLSASGSIGPSGLQGISGYSGYSSTVIGPSGYSGYSGSGISGYSGYSGTGTSGYSGYSGDPAQQSGYSGYSGISGYSGLGATGIVSQVAGVDFTTTSLTAVNITGLTFAASANKLYEIDVLLRVQSSNSSGLKLAIQYSVSGATTSIGVYGATSSGNGSNYYLDSFGTTSSTSFATVANVDRYICIKGIVVTGSNAGNITIQIAKTSSGTATVYIGSRMTVTELA